MQIFLFIDSLTRRYIIYDYLTTKTEEKPQVREQLAKYGINYLTDGDLITLLLGSGNKEKSVQKMAIDVLEIIRSKNTDVLFEELIKTKGIGKGKASIICAALELGKRYNSAGKRIQCAKDIIPMIQFYALQKQEHFISISLDGGNKIISSRIVAIGTTNKMVVHPREVFFESIKEMASSIIVCHNHPSGNTNPSEEDIMLTHRLYEASELLGIRFLDHIIISTTGYFSFNENNLIGK